MTTEQKIIRAKVGLLELAKQLGLRCRQPHRKMGERLETRFQRGFPVALVSSSECCWWESRNPEAMARLAPKVV